MINIWIGYDDQFSQNNIVQEHSITKHSTIPVKINYLKLDNLLCFLTRGRDKFQSTDSAFTRWLVPYLSNYSGWNLYMDSDMMLRDDLSKLLSLCDDSKAVMVAKHPRYELHNKKFNQHAQINYDRKYWSSLILFNSNRCTDLTLEYVNFTKSKSVTVSAQYKLGSSKLSMIIALLSLQLLYTVSESVIK
jgi:lipopolysaccharide biosynthesis glycosyltransferase